MWIVSLGRSGLLVRERRRSADCEESIMLYDMELESVIWISVKHNSEHFGFMVGTVT